MKMKRGKRMVKQKIMLLLCIDSMPVLFRKHLKSRILTGEQDIRTYTVEKHKRLMEYVLYVITFRPERRCHILCGSLLFVFLQQIMRCVTVHRNTHVRSIALKRRILS